MFSIATLLSNVLSFLLQIDGLERVNLNKCYNAPVDADITFSVNGLHFCIWQDWGKLSDGEFYLKCPVFECDELDLSAFADDDAYPNGIGFCNEEDLLEFLKRFFK